MGSNRPSAQRTEEFIDPIGGKFRYKERRADGTTWYRYKEGRKIHQLPSVTTICGIGYDEWASKNEAESLLKAVQLTQEYEDERSRYHFNGVPFPDLETVVPVEVLEWKWRKAVRGHVMHEAVEMFLTKGQVFETTETDRAAMWNSWMYWWSTVKHRIRPLGCELMVANFDDGWAGQMDLVAKLDRDTIIIDHKFGKPNPSYRMQLAAYCNSTHVLSTDGTWRPTKSVPKGGFVVSTIYDEETESASTGVTQYNTSDDVYAEFLARKKILDQSLLPWREQLNYAYVEENVRW